MTSFSSLSVNALISSSCVSESISTNTSEASPLGSSRKNTICSFSSFDKRSDVRRFHIDERHSQFGKPSLIEQLQKFIENVFFFVHTVYLPKIIFENEKTCRGRFKNQMELSFTI